MSKDDDKKDDIFNIEYNEEELANALNSLLAADDRVHDARHILGYRKEDYKLSKLQKITATRILDYQKIMSQPDSPSEAELIEKAQEFAKNHGPILNLQQVIQSQSPKMALAAEFKRASPSKGDIAVDVDVGVQGKLYTESGANIISILTESRWFKGSLADLTRVRLETNNSNDNNLQQKQRPAILRKEFVTETYQIAEAAASGADTILLIVAVLPQNRLKQLIDYARSTFPNMEPLVEVHAMEELDVAIQAGAKVIGVNNRNLHTFQLDLQQTEMVAQQLEKQELLFHHHHENNPYTICALSGMSTAMDVHRYRKIGVGMCLIGESLMRSSDPSKAIAALCLDPEDFMKSVADSAGGAYTAGTKLIKVCGITNPKDALLACQNGANLIGIIFVPKSKRCVKDMDQAKEIVQCVQQFGERQSPIKLTEENGNDDAIRHLMTSSLMLQEEARKRPLVVGVFQNQSPEYIQEVVRKCGLDVIQLHGKEGMEAANPKHFNGTPAIRVVDIETQVDPNTGETKTSEGAVESLLSSLTCDPLAVLLDTSIKGAKNGGGTGVTFDWNVAKTIQQKGLPVIIAGGLKPDNVQDCVTSCQPWGVDVSSGLEACPGQKDPEKVKTFLRHAREAALVSNQTNGT